MDYNNMEFEGNDDNYNTPPATPRSTNTTCDNSPESDKTKYEYYPSCDIHFGNPFDTLLDDKQFCSLSNYSSEHSSLELSNDNCNLSNDCSFDGPPPGLSLIGCETNNSLFNRVIQPIQPPCFGYETDKRARFNEDITKLIVRLQNSKSGDVIKFDYLQDFITCNFKNHDQMLNHLQQKKVSAIDEKVAEFISNFIDKNKSNIDAKLDLDRIPYFNGEYTFNCLRKIECNKCKCTKCRNNIELIEQNNLKKAYDFFTEKIQKNNLFNNKKKLNPENLFRRIGDILLSPNYCTDYCEVVKVTFYHNMSMKQVVEVSLQNNFIKRYRPVIKVKLGLKTQEHPLEKIFFKNGLSNNEHLEKFEDFDFSPT